MNCRDFEQRLCDYLDDALGRDARGEMDAHRLECSSCETAVEEAAAQPDPSGDLGVLLVDRDGRRRILNRFWIEEPGEVRQQRELLDDLPAKLELEAQPEA